MPSERELLEAIYAAPHDDAPRLVYGDWLQSEKSDPRGELIQVQCRLADPATSPKDRRKLRTAENKLLKTLVPEMMARVVAALGATGDPLVRSQMKVEVRRGFLAYARVTTDALRKLDDLFEIAPLLTELEVVPTLPVDGKRALDAMDFESRHLARLEKLQLRVPLDDASIDHLAACPRLSGLKELTIAGLQWFDAAGASPIGAKGMRTLAASPHLASLRALTVEANTLGNDGIEALLRSPHGFRSLETLDVSANGCDGDLFAMIAGAPELPSLRRLNVRYTQPVSPEQAATLASAPSLKGLRALDLEKCQIGPKGLEAFLDAMEMQLEELCVASNSLGDAGGVILASSPKVATLRVLDVTKNRLGKKAIKAIASSSHLTGLQKVLINDRESEEARTALLESKTLASAQVYYRGRLLAMTDDD